MADSGDSSEQQITFNVKSSAEAKYVLTGPTTMTITDLKQKLSTSEYANLPPERQRLIYSGRVLKDHDTIGSCKIKDGNTVHLVRGAESNSRQNPANQGGSAAIPGAGQVPSNIAAGTGASNPLAQLTGARHAGLHGLPGADMFGADGGMGAPPNPDAMLRQLEDPNFAQAMNEALNNPAVINMLRENPMIRNNPMARAAIENPELRRMMLNPDMIRMQMQMQQAMGGGGAGGAGTFPMPGATDTTAPAEGQTGPNPTATGAAGTGSRPPAANPFAALFPGGGAGGDGAANAANPFGNLFGSPPPPAAGTGGAEGGQQQQQQRADPFAAMAQHMMQNPQLMQEMMGMMGGGAGAGSDAAGAGFNPWAAFGGGGAGGGAPEAADDRPPEVRYENQLRQLNDMGFFEFERNVQALRRSGGSVQGAIEYLLSNP